MRNPKWYRNEIILALDLYFDEGRGLIDAKNPKIVELSEILNRLPIFDIKPDKEKFRNSNGVGLKLSNFLALDPNYNGKGMESYSKLDKEVFEEFFNDRGTLRRLAAEIRVISMNSALSQEIASIEKDEVSGLDMVKEGQVLYKLHKVRERDKKIVEAKKKKAIKDKGFLDCEACGFNFEARYGDLGKGFIECHHITPLSQFESSKETSLSDLALVCSNCHRMLHRNFSFKNISEFRVKLNL